MSSGESDSVGLPPLAGDRTLPVSRRAVRRLSRKSWSTVPTRTVICSWSYAATSVATVRPASVDPTGTSSSTKEGSAESSTWARPATHRAPWPPSGQSPWGSRSLPWAGSALMDEKRQLKMFGTPEGSRTRYWRKIVTKRSLPQPYRNRAGTTQNVADGKRYQRGQ
jgi:hypothetical protein